MRGLTNEQFCILRGDFVSEDFVFESPQGQNIFNLCHEMVLEGLLCQKLSGNNLQFSLTWRGKLAVQVEEFIRKKFLIRK